MKLQHKGLSNMSKVTQFESGFKSRQYGPGPEPLTIFLYCPQNSASSELPQHKQDTKKWPGINPTYSSRKRGKRREGGMEGEARRRRRERKKACKKKKKKIINIAQGTEGNSSQMALDVFYSYGEFDIFI